MISVTVTDAGVTTLFLRAAAAVKDVRPVLRAMGTTLMSITMGTFNSVGAQDRPAAWPPKRDGSPSNLQSRNPVLSKSFFLTVTENSAIVGNPMPYAAIHQFGGVIKPKAGNKWLRFQINGNWYTVASVTIPARPFFPIVNGAFTPRAGERIAAAGQRALNKLLGAT